MKLSDFSAFISFSLVIGLCNSEAAEYFVSLAGKDSGDGSRGSSFASFRRAQEAVRAHRQTHPDEGVKVTFEAGFYSLDRTLEFTPADSGNSTEKPVHYTAAPGAKVVISGGRRISGWQLSVPGSGIWKTRVAPQDWRFTQLWVNGNRALRARTPNYWEFSVLDSVAEEPATEGRTGSKHTFTAKPAALRFLEGLDAADLKDVEVLVFHKWDTTRERLATTSPKEGVFTTYGKQMQGWNRMERNSHFYLENFLAALDAPGEWYLDREGWLYYWPRPGEDMPKAEVIAPTLEQFLRFKGNSSDPKEWVKYISFEGLNFRFGELNLPEAGLPPAQAAMNANGTVILLDGAQDIRFKRCAVEHVGATPFWFRQACRDCRVEETRLFDLGMAGVRIGEMNIVPEAERTGGITIDNCIIQSGGRITPHAAAVWIGHSADNAITHCDIGDFFYTSVSVGWRWGYAESAAKRNRIEFNHLHHLGYRILSDMGGVYTLGPSEGTVVRNNVIHDVYSTRYGGWGLYPDEGSTGILYENNLVYDVRDGCVHQHYGKENVFRNNILAFSEEGQVALTRAEPHLSFTFENNIVYWDDGSLLGYAGWKNGAKVVLQKNVYWRAGAKPFDFAGMTWGQWKAKGNDDLSVIADPLFVDVAKRDFRLQPDSPAYKLGFKAFNPAEAGVYGDPAWRKLAQATTYPKPYIVPEAEPLKLSVDFEQGSASPFFSLGSMDTENHDDFVSVTDSIAAAGKRSLKVSEGPGLKAEFNPHVYLQPHYTKGTARLAYKIRLEPGAVVRQEWRSQGNPFTTGPNLLLEPGAISVANKKLMELPPNAWIGVEITTPVGKSESRWKLQITLPDGTQKEFADLRSDPKWKELSWLGFSSYGREGSAFYLDDLALENH